ncbi:hypothetical protein L9F63_014267, partial [Diploptera punctata]
RQGETPTEEFSKCSMYNITAENFRDANSTDSQTTLMKLISCKYGHEFEMQVFRAATDYLE